jgi:glycine/serine hydroxymethyltransferase
MGETEMAIVGSLLARVLRGRGDDSVIATVRSEVRDLCLGFDPYPEAISAASTD